MQTVESGRTGRAFDPVGPRGANERPRRRRALGAAAPPPRGGRSRTKRSRYFFIKRPIFAMVISIVIVLLGFFALARCRSTRIRRSRRRRSRSPRSIPARPPRRSCRPSRRRSNSSCRASRGSMYYKTSCASDGAMAIQVYFDISRDLDLAAVDVQNRVQIADAADPAAGAAARRHGRQGADRHPHGARAQVRRSALGCGCACRNYAKIYVAGRARAACRASGRRTTFGGLQFAMLISSIPIGWRSSG